MIQTAVASLQTYFLLQQKDPGPYRRFKAGPMAVELAWYQAEGLGNVSAIRGKAMAGLMTMETLVIDPFYRDMPLFSFDYIAAMGKHTLLVEYYDTLSTADAFDQTPLLAAKAQAASLPDHDLGQHWYDHLKLAPSFAKRGKKSHVPGMEAAFQESLKAYLALCAQQPPLTVDQAEEKRAKAQAYVTGVLEQGGPSTDAFVKALGPEKTEALFTRMVFGTRK